MYCPPTISQLKRPAPSATPHLLSAIRLVQAALAGTVLLGKPAWAQTPSPLAEWQYSAGIPLEQLFQPQLPAWRIRLGAAFSMQPRYEGSSRYHLVAGPGIDIRYRDLFFVSTGEGVGVNVLSGRNWRVAIASAYDLGRRARDDSGHLSGLDNINPAPAIKLIAEYVVSQAFPLVLRADVRRSVGGSNGWIGDLGAYMPMPGSSRTFFWFAGPSVTLADSRYMNSWFGVTRAEAARSRYPSYSANPGIKSVNLGITAVWQFRRHWFVSADAAIEQLVGSAAHSPITQRATNTVVDLSINYQF